VGGGREGKGGCGTLEVVTSGKKGGDKLGKGEGRPAPCWEWGRRYNALRGGLSELGY